MKNDNQAGYGKSKTSQPTFEGAKREYNKHLRSIEEFQDKKVLLFEKNKAEGDLLDESQIREEI